MSRRVTGDPVFDAYLEVRERRSRWHRLAAIPVRLAGLPVAFLIGWGIAYWSPRIFLALGWVSIPVAPDWAYLLPGAALAYWWWAVTSRLGVG